MTAYTIRELHEDEQQELEAFLVIVSGESERSLARKYIDCMFSSDYRKPTFLVALNGGGRIIGAASYSEEFFTVGTWGISWVGVHTSHRNQGIGGALIIECEQAISRKAPKDVSVILATYPNKTRLYDKAGYQKGTQDTDGGYFMTKILRFCHSEREAEESL